MGKQKKLPVSEEQLLVSRHPDLAPTTELIDTHCHLVRCVKMHALQVSNSRSGFYLHDISEQVQDVRASYDTGLCAHVVRSDYLYVKQRQDLISLLQLLRHSDSGGRVVRSSH